jgi:hypothetical protein
MIKSKSFYFVTAISLAAVGGALADHNSVWGEGWASMPNDIHNQRIDTRDEENDAFLEFVQMGAGADSVNSFLLDDTSSGGSAEARGSGGQGGSRGGRS